MALLIPKTIAAWLLALSLSFAGPALAADHSGHDHAADKRTTKWQTSRARPSLAVSATFAPDGQLWIASIRDHHLFVSHSADQGKSFSAPVRVTREPEYIAGDGENRPKIVAAREGHIYVSYTQSLDQPMTGHVRFSRSVDGGKSFSAPVTVNDDRQVISHRFEALGVNARGEIHLAWLDKRDLHAARAKGANYSGAAVYHAVSRDGGKTFTNSKVLDHSCECCRVAMAIGRDGVPVIAWRHVYEGNIRDHALARLDGTSAPVRASHDQWRVDACPHHGPALAIDNQGVYHLAWFSNAPQRQGLFYAHSADRGRAFSKPLAIGDKARAPAHPHVLAVGPRVFLAWKEFDGEKMTIRMLQSANHGAAWSAPTTVATTAGASDHPFLLAHGDAAYLSWSTAQEGYRLLPLETGPAP
jgi:hypothetical protein